VASGTEYTALLKLVSQSLDRRVNFSCQNHNCSLNLLKVQGVSRTFALLTPTTRTQAMGSSTEHRACSYFLILLHLNQIQCSVSLRIRLQTIMNLLHAFFQKLRLTVTVKCNGLVDTKQEDLRRKGNKTETNRPANLFSAYSLISKQAASLAERNNRLTHSLCYRYPHFELFWSLGILLGYLATSGAKSYTIFLLGDPDFL